MSSTRTILLVLIGVIVASVLSAQQATSQITQTLRVQYVPHPRDYLTIRQGETYVVPAGSILVLTGIGIARAQSNADYQEFVEVFRNGNRDLAVAIGRLVLPTIGVANTPYADLNGVTYRAGDSIAVEATAGSNIHGRLYGYLARE